MSRNRLVLLIGGVTLLLGGMIWAGSHSSSDSTPYRPMLDPRLRAVGRMNFSNPENRMHLRNPYPLLHSLGQAGNLRLGARAASTEAKVDSPQDTVQTQLQLLQHGSDDAFRATFMPEVQSKLTPEAIQVCRKRVAELRVKPDWEMARNGKDSEGRPTRWVSMFGKSDTGFHNVNGRWLADAVWCNPPGYP